LSGTATTGVTPWCVFWAENSSWDIPREYQLYKKPNFPPFLFVSVGQDHTVFVADFYNNHSQQFTQNGKFLSIIAKYGNEPGQIKGKIAHGYCSR